MSFPGFEPSPYGTAANHWTGWTSKPTTFPDHLKYASTKLDLVLSVHKHNSLSVESRSAALATIHERYPDQDWLHVFTEGSDTGSFGSAGAELSVDKSWSRLLDGHRRTQLSALPRVEDVVCFRVNRT
ncbi:hydroxysteroid dehydrogenase-like protein 1 [Trichonephila clavipes]|nr:hydroxysteroid dehydrogenase-like protein 1 [Trichonephila clavipes]